MRHTGAMDAPGASPPPLAVPGRTPVVLLDTATLYYRAFHAMPSSLRAPDGSAVGAVRGFVDMLAVLVRTLGPSQLVACWDDDWRPAWRVALVPSYKAHRTAADGSEAAPEGLGDQVAVISALLEALGVPRVGAAACEADDVIGTLSTRLAASRVPVDVVSGDRDLLQLVDDADDVRVVSITRGVKDAEVVDDDALSHRYGVAGGAGYLAMSVLRGDPSDGLPGVPGVGEKTAAAMVQRFGDVAGVVASAGDPGSSLTSTQRRRVSEAADYLSAAQRVVTVLRDADVPELPAAPGLGSLLDAADHERLDGLSERWGLASPLGRLLSACAVRPPTE